MEENTGTAFQGYKIQTQLSFPPKAEFPVEMIDTSAEKF